jgi:hypothetical protein
MAKGEVRARVDAIIAAKERAVAVSALSDRDKVLTKLRQWLDGMPTDSNQLRAAELLGKASGTFTEQVSINQGDRDASEVAAEIERILAGVVSEDEKEIAPDSEHLH